MQIQLKNLIRLYALGKARDRTDGNVALGAALAGTASAGVKQHARHNRIGNFREAWKWGDGAGSRSRSVNTKNCENEKAKPRATSDHNNTHPDSRGQARQGAAVVLTYAKAKVTK